MLTGRPRHARRRHGDSGAELIELALTLPMLLVILLAIVDFGLLFQRSEVLAAGVREGARVAIQQGTTPTEIENRVVTYVQMAGGVPVTPANPAVTVTTGTLTTADGSWPTRTVNVNYTHDYVFLPYVIGWFGGAFNQTTLQAQATMRILAPGAGP